jgi:hypothetical protein
MDYKVEQFNNKTYRITTELNGEEISFNVVVANDESEIPDLVAHHLNFLQNPPVINYQSQPSIPNVNELLLQQQELILQLQAEINSIKQKIE